MTQPALRVNRYSHKTSLINHFMQTAKWVSLLLLLSIGGAMAYSQYLHQQAINWGFVALCVAGGLLLFWIGHCLSHHDCAKKPQTKLR